LILNYHTTKDQSKSYQTFTYESSRTAIPWGSADQKATAHLETEPERPKSNSQKMGPIKPPLNVRMTCRFDYQPDICKDYKETGYCGYGDNCKFLHDRGDYKNGWQLEQEWEEMKFRPKTEQKFEEDEEEKYPFACPICRGPFMDPVATRCGHYFCEKCAVDYDRKYKKCFNCEEKTNGLFNTAKVLIQKIKQRDLDDSKSQMMIQIPLQNENNQ